MVECDLAKVEVAGSTPVSRSITLLVVAPRPGEGLCCSGAYQASTQFGARYPSGKGEVCKTFMRRFDSDPRLQNFRYLFESTVVSRKDWIVLNGPENGKIDQKTAQGWTKSGQGF